MEYHPPIEGELTKIPAGHPLEGEYYQGKITHTDKDGTYTVYLQNIERVIIKDHKGNEIDPADLSSSLQQSVSNTIDEATFGNAAAEADSYALPITDTFAMLDKVKSTLNESGIDSELRDIVNHDGAVEMLENLKEDGLDLLEVPGHEEQSPEEQLEAVLLAARDATIERGLDMPGEAQDNTSTNSEHEYSNVDDDYSLV